MAVPHEEASNPDHEQNTDETFLYLRTNKDARDSIREVYVNVVAHLWLLALQGPHPLHSENAYQAAERLYAWVMRRFMPAQVVPTGLVFMDTFEGPKATPRVCRTDLSYIDVEHGASVINYGYKGRGPSYIMRPIDDAEVMDTQRISASPSFIDPYLPEDTMHMGSLAQLHKVVLQSAIRAPFAPLTGISARAPELLPTRIYPLNGDGRKDSGFGVVCICPNGFNFVLIKFTNLSMATSLEQWQLVFDRNSLGAGPLVHRPNAVAVVPGGGGGLGLIMPRTDDPFASMEFDTLKGWTDDFNSSRVPCDSVYYLDAEGMYSVVDHAGMVHLVHNRDLDLLPVGKHLFVRAPAVIRWMQEALNPPVHVELDDQDVGWIKGWLRYPDECDEDHMADPAKVYVVIRSRAGGSRIIAVDVGDCALEPGDDDGGVQTHV
jgi:hypothetical protein